ncbi:hypothetical protein GUJ93_ZPchr0014g46830 [Zizania palustris]|uniref:Uncharacterized protein n=1 Tax=Zizania palustris TaxID=103762 RepID=A0A8J5SVU4_ZIZPA|nr:hypothetical protein GUJ93_ZPchr0014g46830 [Zizania palustris]
MISIALTLSFAQTQVFISLLCAVKYAIFLFYAGWVLVMSYDGLHRVAPAGDERHPAGGHALHLGKALVLEEVRQGQQVGCPG